MNGYRGTHEAFASWRPRHRRPIKTTLKNDWVSQATCTKQPGCPACHPGHYVGRHRPDTLEVNPTPGGPR